MYYRHGAQGIMDGASNAQLDSEFGTHREEDVVAQILEKGDIVESDVCFRPRTSIVEVS